MELFEPRLTVVIPTVGRETLRATLNSLALRPQDSVIVVGDGPQPDAARIVKESAASLHILYLETRSTHFYGHAQRTMGMHYATGTHILFQDDDDVYVDGAFDNIRAAIAETPDLPILGQMQDRNGVVIWRTKELKLGNVSTQMLVLPNVPFRFGTWGAHTARGVRGGDFGFFQTLKYDRFVWWSHVWTLARPVGEWNEREFLYGV